MMKPFFTSSAVFWVCCWWRWWGLTPVMSYPNGAGGCAGGQPAVEGNHLSRPGPHGSLLEGSLLVFLDDQPLDESSALPVDVSTGVNHTLTVFGNSFRGILLRLEPNTDSNINWSSTSLQVAPQETNLHEATVCQRPVLGLTHKSASLKASATAILRLDEEMAGLALDVTVVLENTPNQSAYYYSSFTLNAVAETPSIPQATEPIPATVLNIIVNDTDLSTLEQAISQAGLAVALYAGGPYTVLAPVNSAFNSLDPTLLDYLLQDQQWILHLNNLVLYHVVTGTYLASDLTEGQRLISLNTETLTVHNAQGTLSVSGKYFASSVLGEEEVAGNGVVHKVNEVLLPRFVALDILETLPNITNFGNALRFETLLQLIQLAGLEETIQSGIYTLLAPPDSAFQALSSDLIDALLAPSNVEALRSVLKYHLLPGVYPSTLLEPGPVTTVEGPDVTLVISGNSITINGADVLVNDELAKNGISHVISAVLLPPGLAISPSPPVPTPVLSPTQTPISPPVPIPVSPRPTTPTSLPVLPTGSPVGTPTAPILPTPVTGAPVATPLATSAPILSPTAAPTIIPLPATSAPIPSPSGAPLVPPSITAAPIISQSSAPSQGPVGSPPITASPILAPSVGPSGAPPVPVATTLAPVALPIAGPSAIPVVVPAPATGAPLPVPTVRPSPAPVYTVAPLAFASDSPSAQPVRPEPTTYAPIYPTYAPLYGPIVVPVAFPITAAPSLAPAPPPPTESPVVAPVTPAPSQFKTASPTLQPTSIELYPTVSPVKEQYTLTPVSSSVPTPAYALPSSAPEPATASDTPSSHPILHPESDFPSSIPTLLSTIPSRVPTLVPAVTGQPSLAPTTPSGVQTPAPAPKPHKTAHPVAQSDFPSPTPTIVQDLTATPSSLPTLVPATTPEPTAAYPFAAPSKTPPPAPKPHKTAHPVLHTVFPSSTPTIVQTLTDPTFVPATTAQPTVAYPFGSGPTYSPTAALEVNTLPPRPKPHQSAYPFSKPVAPIKSMSWSPTTSPNDDGYGKCMMKSTKDKKGTGKGSMKMMSKAKKGKGKHSKKDKGMMKGDKKAYDDDDSVGDDSYDDDSSGEDDDDTYPNDDDDNNSGDDGYDDDSYRGDDGKGMAGKNGKMSKKSGMMMGSKMSRKGGKGKGKTSMMMDRILR